MKTYEVTTSVEKVYTQHIAAKSEEEAIEIANERLMNGREDFSYIMSSDAEEL